MKSIKFSFSALVALLFLVSCSKENPVIVDVDALVEEIAFADNKQVIQPSELPSQSIQIIENQHFETYIEQALNVPERGYEVRLGNENILFFDRNGNILRPARDPFGTSPCGQGIMVAAEDLPSSILDYITEHYPDADIFRAKKKPHGYLVKISGHLILIFDTDGLFVEATTHFFHCRPLGVRIDITTLPDVIVEYINNHYNNPHIKIAFEKTNGNYILGITTDDGRKILGFDVDGNLIFERP